MSEELDELLALSDRLVVMARGRLSPPLPVAEATVERIGLWMSGLWDEPANANAAAAPAATSAHAGAANTAHAPNAAAQPQTAPAAVEAFDGTANAQFAPTTQPSKQATTQVPASAAQATEGSTR